MLVVSLALVGVLASTRSAAAAGADLERHAKSLEQQLLAPCCYQQTLDVHSSDLTSVLRREIRDRLLKGESADGIEHDLVSRYGARIRAVPATSPLEMTGFVMMALIAVAGLALWVRARAWIEPDSGVPTPSTQRDRYDEVLEKELKAFDANHLD